MKDLRMMSLLKVWETVTPRDHSWCTSLRWYPPPIEDDSSLSVESSPEPLLPHRRSESSELTISPERRKTSSRSPSKEPYSWWEEPLSTSQMSPVVTQLVSSESISIWWRPEPSQITPMPIPLDAWSTPWVPSWELLSRLRTPRISLS